MKFYPIENDGIRFLLPESSISMVANYDSRYCIIYLNEIDGHECKLPLHRGNFVFYVLKSNLYNFFGSAALPQSLESFLNGGHGNSYYFIGEDGYEINECEGKSRNAVKAGSEDIDW